MVSSLRQPTEFVLAGVLVKLENAPMSLPYDEYHSTGTSVERRKVTAVIFDQLFPLV